MQSRFQRQPELRPEIPKVVSLSPSLYRSSPQTMYEDYIDQRFGGRMQELEAQRASCDFAVIVVGMFASPRASKSLLEKRKPRSW